MGHTAGMGPAPLVASMGASRMVAVPVDLHTMLTDWPTGVFALGAGVASVLAVGLYARAVRRLGARGRRWSRGRTVAFVVGIATVEIALGSPEASLTASSFPAHVIQHLLLMIIAPPLLALGAPMTLVLQTVRRPLKRRVLSVLHSRVFAVASHPLPVFFAYYLSMYAFFLTGALGYAMGRPWLMDSVNLGFLGGATLFWWPMVGLDPIPRWSMSPGFKLLNLMIGIPVESFLGIALLSTVRPVAPMYTLTGSHTGGAVLWAASEIATIVALAPVFVQWTRADARAARRLDARLDAGLDITTPPAADQGLAANLRSLRR